MKGMKDASGGDMKDVKDMVSFMCFIFFMPFMLLMSARAAQQTPAPPQFRAGVDVFQLEVTVLDQGHQPVQGLKSSNFSIYENGKLQPIVDFQEIEMPEYDGPLPESKEENAPDVAATRYADRRLITVVMDDWGWPLDRQTRNPMDPQLIPTAKDAARFIVNSIGALDLVSINLTRDLRYFPDFSNNSWKLTGNIDKFKPLPDGAERMYLLSLAQQSLHGIGLMPALTDLIDRIAKYPQHQKLIVVIANDEMITRNDCCSTTVAGRGGGGDSRWVEVMRAAQQAGISLSSIEVRGLTVASPTNDLLRTLAENTGGVAVRQSNDLAPGITEIFRQHHSYYLIGFQQTGPKDGKFRRLDVHLDRPGIIHTRSGYFAPGPADVVKGPTMFDEGVDRAIGALEPADSARRLFTSASLRAGLIHAAVEIGSAEYAVGAWTKGAQAAISVARASGSVIASTTARLDPGARGVEVDIPLRDSQGQAVDPAAGPFHVSVRVFTDGAALQDGVDAIATGTLLGDPNVSRGGIGPRAPLRPSAEPQFVRTERIHVEWPALGPIEKREVRLLRRTGQPLPFTPVLVDKDINGQPWITTELPLSSLAAGDYAIELVVQSGEKAERKLVAFRVGQ